MVEVLNATQLQEGTEADEEPPVGDDHAVLATYPVSSGLNVIIVVTGGFGNVILIYFAFKKSKLMTVVNQLLIVQCLMNLSECFLLVPVRSFLSGLGLVFSHRNLVCRIVLSWTFANWLNFCFSIFVISAVRLLYTVAPLRMHRVRDELVANITFVLLGASEMVWFIFSLLMEEQPFGSATCVTDRYTHSSSRIVLAIVFNVSSVLLTLGVYIGIATSTSRPLIPTKNHKQRNIITVKTGIIQCVFLLLTFLLPIVTRLLSYHGRISPTILSQGNMFLVNFSMCSVYPLLTMISSSVLRTELLARIKCFSRSRNRIVPIGRTSFNTYSSKSGQDKNGRNEAR